MAANHQRRSQDQPEQLSTARKLPELPPEVLRAVAKATLAACDSSLGAWLRLSMVSRDWRQTLKGEWKARPVLAGLLTKCKVDLAKWPCASRPWHSELKLHTYECRVQ